VADHEALDRFTIEDRAEWGHVAVGDGLEKRGECGT
jgi:hypothetical protein